MSKNKGAKKLLAVFMAALMVLSCWVFTPISFEAAAANGTYWLNVRVNVTNKADSSGNIQDSYWTITYKTNNGRGPETTMKYDLKSSAYSVLSNESNGQYIHVSVPGFPTKFYYYHDATWNDIVTYKVTDIYVSSYSQNGGTSVSAPDREIKSGGWGNSEVSGTISWDSADKYPYVSTSKTPSAASTPANIGIPPLGDSRDVSISTTKAQYYSTDQYGVRYEPTSYSISGVTGLTTSGGSNGSAYTITATTSTTKNTAAISQTATVTMNWKNSNSNQTQHGNTTKGITVYNPRYKITYNGNGGTLGTNYTYAYYNQAINAATSTATSNNVEGLTAEKLPSAGNREGYTFNGIWSSATGGTQKTASDKVTANGTWFAHWTVNQYNAVFKGNRGTYPNTPYEFDIATVATNFGSMPTAPLTVEDYDNGDYHYTYNNKWKNAAGNVYATSALPNMTTAGAIYWAQYDATFIKADYTDVTKWKNEADRIKSNPNYETIYTLASRNALDAAINSVVDGKGRTQQDVVDGYAQAIKEAIDNLEAEKYSVVFVDSRDNSVIKFIYPTVFGDSISYPEAPSISYDKNYHYTFKEWVGTANETNLSTVEKNITLIAKFDKTEHNFTTEPIESSCIKEGGTKYTCSCGYTYTEYAGTTGDHQWDTEWTIDTEATCTTAGSKSHHCLLCGAKTDVTVIDALNHDYTGVKESVVVPASCENDGVSIKECTRCGYNHYITHDKLEHNMVDNVTPATCTSKGYTTSICSNCGRTLVGTFTDPIDHNYVKKDSECVAPSCVGVGYDVSYCSACGLKKYDIIPATGHIWNTNATIDIAPTCTAKGQKSIHCSVCDAINEDTIEEIAANGHTYDDSKAEMLVPDTCNNIGIKSTPCSVDGCGYFKVEEVDDIKGHDLQKDTVNSTEANCTQPGVEIEKCSRCDYSETTVTPATGHSYTDTTHDATCGNAGYIEHKCACGHKYDEYTTPATGNHDWTFSQVTDKGVTTLTGTCENCDATFSKEVSSDHSFTVVKTYTPATCSAKGSIVIGCSDTGCPAEVSVELSEDADAHKSFTTAITNPKCTENGKAVTTCDDCGETVATENIPAKGHTFTTKSSETKGDCRNAGKVVLKCADCDETTIVLLSVDKNAHVYELTSSEAATCDSAAYDEYTCKVCNDSTYKQLKGEALGHLWGEATVEQDDTIVTITRTCTRTDCGATDVQTVNVFAGHNFARLENVTDATCKNTGLMKLYCTDDGCDEYIDITVPVNAAAHTLTTDTKAPDCDNDGYVKTYCSECNEPVSNVTINKLGHDFFTNLDSATATTPATCTTAGTKSVKCSRCDATADVTIPKLGHSYEKVTGGKTPTCSEYGWDVYECQNGDCDESYNSLLDKLGHDFDEALTVVTNPTCTEKGYTTKHCKTCDEDVVMDYTDPTDHDFIPTVTPPTCLEKGYTTHTCQNTGCGYYYVDTYTDALGHDFDNEGTVIYDGNCAEQKVIKHTCNHDGCDETWNEYVGEIGNHDYQFAETVAPKCLEGGYDLYKCSLCGSEKKENFTKALGHDWDYWEITKYPSETADGQKVNGSQKHVCKRCGTVETEEIIEGKYYLVTFYNHDGTRLIRPAYYSYGKAAKMPDFTPTRVADTGYTYTFKGYNFSQAEIDCVTKRMAVIAEYDAHERSYAVTYRNEDGTVLQTVSSVKYSKITDSYTAGTPTKASDEYYTYTFNSWSVNCDPESGTAVVTATYTQKLTDENVTPDGNHPGIFAKFIAWFKTLLKKLFGIEL